MTQYLSFRWLFDKPKTGVFGVYSLSSGEELGRIFWYASWRQYCFFPTSETVWSRGCLHQIQDFMNKLMEERKKKNLDLKVKSIEEEW